MRIPAIMTLDCVQRDPNDTLARYVYGQDANFEPGAGWHYSNTNYTLLGMVIEKATGMPLAEAYRTHIYEPLGMTSTFLDCYEDPVIDVVHGYTALATPRPISLNCMNPSAGRRVAWSLPHRT